MGEDGIWTRPRGGSARGDGETDARAGGIVGRRHHPEQVRFLPRSSAHGARQLVFPAPLAWFEGVSSRKFATTTKFSPVRADGFHAGSRRAMRRAVPSSGEDDV